jgi:hypothetical protein
MRFELSLILWVIAALSVGWGVSGGSFSGNFVASVEQEKELSPADLRGEVSAQAAPALPSIQAETLADIEIETRPLFAVAAPVVFVPEAAPLEQAAEPELSLRGIVRSDLGWRAVFGGTDADANYVVIGLGETIGGIEVLAIGPGEVTVRTLGDKTERTLLLRASGETP